MCGICGCDEDNEDHASLTHTHDEHEHSQIIQIEQDIFAKNNSFAQTNRNYFLKRSIFALNLMSSPGSGKTTLLERTIIELKNRFNIATIEGDQHTQLDSQRITAAGGYATQINTGKMCHLDAHQVGHAMEQLPIKDNMILFIKNVGNLVCPSLFDLGENHKVTILSVTEGEDKPLKYPDMFRASNLMILNKIDLLPYLEFDIDQCIDYARQVNPTIQVLKVSAKTGEGFNEWYQWLELNSHNLRKINV